MKEWEIWCAGYVATGESATAQLIGKCEAETFDEACLNFQYPETIIAQHLNGEILATKGDFLNLDKDHDGEYRRGPLVTPMEPGIARAEALKRGGNYCIWGCQLFDNEADARKAFG